MGRRARRAVDFMN